MKKRLKSIGKFTEPEDIRKPFYLALHWFDAPLIQPVSEEDLLKVLNGIIFDTCIEIEVSID